jgi:hypothetical protein
MFIIKYLCFVSNNPLSRFPQGGKALFGAPSPLGEGWEGGPNDLIKYYLFLIPDSNIIQKYGFFR